VKKRICLKGLTGEIEGKVWESESQLQAGRLSTLDIVLDDSSVSRKHAEVRVSDDGWKLRDLKSTNGTFINGERLQQNEERRLSERDVIQFGKVALMVEVLEDGRDTKEHPAPAAQAASAAPAAPKGAAAANTEEMRVEATTTKSWEDAFRSLAYDRNRDLRPGEQMLALLRAGHHLGHSDNEEELLHCVLNDAVRVLDAQRGAIVLADGPEEKLQLRAIATGRGEQHGRFQFSQNLATRAYKQGESILYTRVNEDPELATYQSIAEGAMSSVLCVVLRTPRRRLGVLHLDRSYVQKPFTEEHLHLADALAASVSAGIESAMMARRQRDLFLNTITILAQAVELRDPYTGGHTARVTNYAYLLAKQLNLSAADLHLIRIGTPLHDIGKIGIDDAILRKPSRLTAEEFEIMKSHTTKGAEILATVAELRPIIPIVRSHHERWDGLGYPDGLAGDKISKLARIVAVADAFDAMTSDRPYHADKKGKPPDQGFAEIEKWGGKQFDPECAAAFLVIRDQVVEQMGTTEPMELNPVSHFELPQMK
jgi:putative nucleotidyltransferase with HDIG domain